MFRVGDEQRMHGWPVGPALLEALGDSNEDVRESLSNERTRLSEHGYPDDLPLPALWWPFAPFAKDAAEERILAAVPA